MVLKIVVEVSGLGVFDMPAWRLSFENFAGRNQEVIRRTASDNLSSGALSRRVLPSDASNQNVMQSVVEIFANRSHAL
ncbi:unnamed protein product [Sympodiomycopsis kandeliae]